MDGSASTPGTRTFAAIRSPRTARVAAVLALVTCVRIAALPLRGTEDVETWKIWMLAASKDVTTVYGVGGNPPVRGVLEWRHLSTTVDYPPVALYELGVAGLVYQLFDPGFHEGRAITSAVKIPGLIFGIGLTLLLWWSAVRFTGSSRAGEWAALAYWANPATILNGEVLGYLDPLMMLPAIGALVLLHLGAAEWCGALLAIAMLTKPQAVLIGPVFALAAWQIGRLRGLVSFGLGGALAAAVILLPYALVGALPNMWLAFGSFYGRRDILSGNAANIWWIVNWAVRAWYQIARLGTAGAFLAPVNRIMAITTFQEAGFPNPRPIGNGLAAATTGWALWQLRRRSDLAVHALGAAFLVHAFFVMSAGMHEHHMMLTVPFLALAAALRPSIRPLFWTVSLVVALNMNLFYGIGFGLGWSVPRAMLLIDLSVLLSFANVAVLVWHGRVLAREVRVAATPASDVIRA